MGLARLSDRALIGMFFETLEALAGMSWIDAVSFSFLDSDQDTEKYGFASMVPAMREWIGGRQEKALKDFVIEIANVHYESSIGIPLKEMRRDKTRQVNIRVSDLVRRTISHWASLLTTLIENGASTAGYDGKNFYAGDHDESGTNQRNDFTATEIPALNVATANNPTASEFADAVVQVVAKFFGFVDDQGEPRNEQAGAFLCMVPVNIWAAAQTAVAERLLTTAGGARESPIRAISDRLTIDVVPNARLSADDEFHVFRTDAPTSKPFIRQQESGTGPMLKVLGAESEHAIFTDRAFMGVDVWRNVGYGQWHQAARATLS